MPHLRRKSCRARVFQVHMLQLVRNIWETALGGRVPPKNHAWDAMNIFMAEVLKELHRKEQERKKFSNT